MTASKDEQIIQTTVRLPKELGARLGAEAKRRILGRGLLIELIIREWMEAHEGEELTK